MARTAALVAAGLLTAGLTGCGSGKAAPGSASTPAVTPGTAAAEPTATAKAAPSDEDYFAVNAFDARRDGFPAADQVCKRIDIKPIVPKAGDRGAQGDGKVCAFGAANEKAAVKLTAAAELFSDVGGARESVLKEFREAKAAGRKPVVLSKSAPPHTGFIEEPVLSGNTLVYTASLWHGNGILHFVIEVTNHERPPTAGESAKGVEAVVLGTRRNFNLR
ncbi:hypothetical protein [Longispora albida]|uniref:hypothetical protein n=1 Tax=Longispora albida TaxID=203523 RepID=UPI0003666AE5|nr:hypothetical protein [Longispora albida]